MGYGTTLKVVNKDITFDSNGRLVWVEEIENVAQGLQILLETQYTSDVLAPAYGFDRESVLASELIPSEQEQYLESLVRAAILQDDRIEEILEYKQEVDNNRIATITAKVQLTSGDLLIVQIAEDLL